MADVAALLARPRRRRLPPRRDRPARQGRRAARRPARDARRSRCRCATEYGARSSTVHSRNAPDIGDGARGAARGRRRRAARRRGLPAGGRSSRPTSSTLDAAFAFELFHAPWEAAALRAAIDGARSRAGRRRLGALQPRLPAPARPRRRGRTCAPRRCSLLTLPGAGVRLPGRRDRHGATAPGADPPYDRAGRDRAPPPDAVGRRAARRLHDRQAVAAAGRSRRAQRRRPARRPATRCCRSTAT